MLYNTRAHVRQFETGNTQFHPTTNPTYTHFLPLRTNSTNPIFHRGKGTPRRKVKKVQRNSGADDKKLQATLKKMNVQPIQAIEEVNMFKEDGNVIHFAAPRGTLPD